MTKLILIRHGRTLWNSSGKFQGQSDIELSQEGISQAEKLAENFPVTHIDRVYSSNLKRAYITGEIIAKKFNVPIIKDKRLCEVSFGSWEGLTYDEIHKKWPNEIETMFSTPDVLTMPEGESFAQVQKRGVEALLDIVNKHPDETIAITAHGGILRTLLAYALHMPLRYIWTLRQDNTAVNIVTFYGDKINVELLNSTAHLSLTQLPKLGRFS